MANELLALAVIPPDALNDDEYRALCEALSESVRGRAFLAEYARRNRHADTEALLAAIGRIEARLQADTSAVQHLREDLRLLLIAIRLARPEIDAAGPATRAVKLAKLLDLLERRLDAMAGGPADTLPDESAATARLHLAVVAPPDEPELPIPSPELFEPRPVSMPPVVETIAAEPAPPRDPLAAIMALSEDERLALFT